MSIGTGNVMRNQSCDDEDSLSTLIVSESPFLSVFISPDAAEDSLR